MKITSLIVGVIIIGRAINSLVENMPSKNMKIRSEIPRDVVRLLSEDEVIELDDKITKILDLEDYGESEITNEEILLTHLYYKTVPLNSKASLDLYQKGLRHKEVQILNRKCLFLFETHLSKNLAKKYISTYPVLVLIEEFQLVIQYYFDARSIMEVVVVEDQNASGYARDNQVMNHQIDYGVYFTLNMYPEEHLRDLELLITHVFREFDDNWINSLMD